MISKTTTETTTDNVTETTVETTTESCATEENRYKTWDEFCQSNIVCNKLRRRPRPKDWLDYKHNRLIIIREDA